MYEAEANRTTAPISVIPPAAAAVFLERNDRILRRTLLPWSEHCTECVWPACYTTCELYSPRSDGRCRRFVDGMVRIDHPQSANGYLLQIRFKQWGKLWTPGNLHLHTPASASRAERRDQQIGNLLQTVPLPNALRRLAVNKRYRLKKQIAQRVHAVPGRPTSFQIEYYNPNPADVPLSVTFRAAGPTPAISGPAIPFQRLLTLSPGAHLVRIPYEEITARIDITRPFNIELVPNHVDHELTLYFGLIDFVEERPPLQSVQHPITKCVVWDLDHTVWDGVLVEDGAAALTLKPSILETMTCLDEHGILQSVVSKNGHDHAMQMLREFKLDHLFLYPQISWSPKGDGIRAIAHELNLGLDHILFVDDSAFEREQVAASCPGTRTLDAKDYLSLALLPECRGAVTEESRSRRQMYGVERNRRQLAAVHHDDYNAFLKECAIRLTITTLSPENLERVHELTQRTNQMNFSGTRYDRDRLRAIMLSPHLQSFVLACEDRFGSYGIVGFGLADLSPADLSPTALPPANLSPADLSLTDLSLTNTAVPLLTDLMFSCRIQAKRIEHAFLGYILAHFRRAGFAGLSARYVKTPRNEPSGRVFADLGMEVRAVDQATHSLFFPFDREIPDDGLVTIDANLHQTSQGVA